MRFTQGRRRAAPSVIIVSLIDVLLVVPGLTHTDRGRNLLRNEGRMKIARESGLSPEKVADSILRALECNTAETVLRRVTCSVLALKPPAPAPAKAAGA